MEIKSSILIKSESGDKQRKILSYDNFYETSKITPVKREIDKRVYIKHVKLRRN